MGHSVNAGLVALSIAISVFGSFVALSLAKRQVASQGAARLRWLIAAAAALGGGTWSMHFVGILSMSGPLPATYDISLTALSLLLAVTANALGLQLVSRRGTAWRPLTAAGALVGTGVAALHYTGMAAMNMPGVVISYDATLVALSTAVGVVASITALHLTFRTESFARHLIAALLMGVGISGMHHLGMAAASANIHLHPSETIVPGIAPAVVAVAVASTMSLLLLLAGLAAHYDRRIAALLRREAIGLRSSEARFRALTENSSDIVAVVDESGKFLYESSSAMRLLGYSTDAILGTRLAALAGPGAERAVDALLDASMRTDGPVGGELILRHQDGSFRHFDVKARDMRSDLAVGGVVMNLRDVTDRVALMRELEAASETDALTGIMNRRGFSKAAVQALAPGAAGTSSALLLFDIDHFKQVNDKYGHSAGDLILASVARACRAQLGSRDVFGRWGGEEFVLLLPGADLRNAALAAERLQSAVSATSVLTVKGEVRVTASFGFATVDHPCADLGSAISRADGALYQAKREGRNCVRVADMHEFVASRA
jgi:diguanylate cyclase (GGDEF)-like protein/PAS domain S-box-containing protein